jgi:DNA repair protein RecN (Recombination protein N)
LLVELSIKNFAIIEQQTVSFDKGLTVLTGETGAGKSIIIDAIHLLVGGRGSFEFVRHGEEKAELEGLFQIDDEEHPVVKKALELGIDIEDGMVILRREISKSGKSICRINGKLVTISTLRELGATMVDIHGQHEHQELMNDSTHLSLLDQFGGQEIALALEEYQEVYEKYQLTKKKLKSLNENEQQMAHRLDLIQFQYEEIQKAKLKPNEDEVLFEEKKRLNNFERLYSLINSSYTALNSDQKGIDSIGAVLGYLEDAAAIDTQYQEMFDTISTIFYSLEDLNRTIRNELDVLEFDPNRLNEIEERWNEINQLKRKYGKTIEEIVLYAETIAAEIETIQNKETHIGQLEKEIALLHQKLDEKASILSELRKKWAVVLTNLIHKELKELYMEKAVFSIHLEYENQHYTSTGANIGEFYISTNPGEPLKPLVKIASGGELSRIMLALKSIFSKHQGVTSIIFDEVDTGVSGRVAQAIAEKIHQVAVNSQVLCISHLPQVAAMADTHLFIAKNMLNGRTKTTVRSLTLSEKVSEIGRMISGKEITELTKQHAEELLSIANEMKKPKNQQILSAY